MIDYSKQGLVPAVVQDYNSGQVLMVAYMNETAYKKTKETGYAWFWSRSRQELWLKGETSGNKLEVKSMWLDCDQDTLLLKVVPYGPACHTGEQSCFYNKIYGEGQETNVSSSKPSPTKTRYEILDILSDVIDKRIKEKPEGSYTVKLIDRGVNQILKKVGEEATEVVMACKDEDQDQIVYETADLFFHTILALKYHGVELEDVFEELTERHGE